MKHMDFVFLGVICEISSIDELCTDMLMPYMIQIYFDGYVLGCSMCCQRCAAIKQS